MSWATAGRQLTAKLDIKWNTVAWSDETANLISASGASFAVPLWRILGRTAETQPPANATFVMNSPSDYYSPFNAASAIHGSISASKGYGVPVRFYLSDDGGSTWERVFTGKIDNLAVNSTRNNQVTITAISDAQSLIRKKLSTAMLTDQSASAIISYVATTLMGITSTDLSPGLTNIPYAWLDDESVFKELVKVAQADGGRLFFDKSGVMTYRNVEDWITQTVYNTVQNAFTVSRFADLGAVFDRLNVYNDVIAVYEPRGLAAGAVVWSLPDAKQIEPGGSTTITARYSKPVINAALQNSKAIDLGGDDKTSSLTVTLTDDYAQQGTITLSNSSTTDYISVVRLEVAGNPIIGRRSRQVKHGVTGSAIDDKTLFITRNEFLQTEAQSELVAQFTRDVTQNVSNTYRFSAPFIPTLDAGYRVSVTETESGINAEGILQAIRWNFRDGAARATYEVIEFEIPDKANYFTLGTDTLDGGKVAFY